MRDNDEEREITTPSNLNEDVNCYCGQQLDESVHGHIKVNSVYTQEEVLQKSLESTSLSDHG